MSLCEVRSYQCLVDMSKETELLLCFYFWILKVLGWKIHTRLSQLSLWAIGTIRAGLLQSPAEKGAYW